MLIFVWHPVYVLINVVMLKNRLDQIKIVKSEILWIFVWK